MKKQSNFNYGVLLLMATLASLSLLFTGCKNGSQSEERSDGTDSLIKKGELFDTLTFLKKLPVLESIKGKSGEVSYTGLFGTEKVNAGSAESWIEAAPMSIRLNNTSIGLLAATINANGLAHFKGLFNASFCNTCNKHIDAMRIIHGQSGSTHKLYYQPVRLCKVVGGTCVGQHDTKCPYEICYTVGTYTLNTNTNEFDAVTAAALSTDSALYTRPSNLAAPYGMQIMRLADDVFYDFKRSPVDNETGDIRSLIYPIRQLDTMAAVNGTVKIWNAAADLEEEPSVLQLKHYLILSSGNVTEVNGSLSIPPSGVLSNLAHICPPRCAAAGFLYKD